jgi:hypothetical protein
MAPWVTTDSFPSLSTYSNVIASTHEQLHLLALASDSVDLAVYVRDRTVGFPSSWSKRASILCSGNIE